MHGAPILDKEPTCGNFNLSSLRAVYCGAAPLDADTQSRIACGFGVAVRQAYGTTETSPIISVAGTTGATNMSGSMENFTFATKATIAEGEHAPRVGKPPSAPSTLHGQQDSVKRVPNTMGEDKYIP